MPKGQAGPNALQPVGRPSALTPARISRILQNVAIGNFLTTACEAAAVPYRTAQDWKRQGEHAIERIRTNSHPDAEVDIIGWIEEHATTDDLTTYRTTADYWGNIPTWAANPAKPWEWLAIVFAVLLAHARARAEASHVRNIAGAAQQDWRASAWWLERTRPQQYGRVDRLEQSGPEGGPIQVEAPNIDRLAERIAALRAQAEATERGQTHD